MTQNLTPDEISKRSLQKATVAGGCFWGMEELLRQIPGVVQTMVGYTGGHLQNPRYEDITTGRTGHAESVEVIFDPKQVSYEKILDSFFRMHDFTTLNRQGNDRGTQYRSVIFYHDENQKKQAQEFKEKVAQLSKKNVVTEIVPASVFYPAEEYHQDYLQKNPGGYTCHFMRQEF